MWAKQECPFGFEKTMRTFFGLVLGDRALAFLCLKGFSGFSRITRTGNYFLRLTKAPLSLSAIRNPLEV